jgi:hypothetical protein
MPTLRPAPSATRFGKQQTLNPVTGTQKAGNNPASRFIAISISPDALQVPLPSAQINLRLIGIG